MRSSLLVPLCGVLLLPVLARAQTLPKDVFAEDARLKQNVSMRAEGIPVGDLLTLLTQKTGVSLRADLYVADDKVIAFSPARPLGDTLHDLAALFNDEWQTALLPNGQTRYILARRLKAQHYEDDLEQEAVTRIQRLLDAQVDALNETPEQFAKRPASDRIRKNLESASGHGRQATRLYSQLSREQKNALFTRGVVNVPFGSVTSAQQSVMREAFEEATATLKALDEKQRAENPNVHIVLDPPEALEQHGARFRLTRTNNAGLSALLVQVVVGQNTYLYVGEFESADQWLLPPHGSPYGHKLNSRETAPAAGRETPKTVISAVPPPASEVDMTAVATSAGLVKDSAWIDRLHALSDAAKTPVLADYWRSPAIVHDLTAAPTDEALDTRNSMPPSSASRSTPVQAMDSFCKPSGYVWWTEGKTLLLRRRDWYAQRRYEVSDRWMRNMIARLRRGQNVPTYGDLCELAALTPRQIAGLNGALEGNGGEALANLERQEGLQEMLALIQASAEAFTSLPLGEGDEKAQAQRRLPALPPSPQQLVLVGVFLDTMRQSATPQSQRGFSAQVFCYTPDMLKAAQSPAPQNVQVNIVWKPGAGSPAPNPLDQRWIFWLPLQIPNDRSNKTEITLLPATTKE